MSGQIYDAFLAVAASLASVITAVMKWHIIDELLDVLTIVVG